MKAHTTQADYKREFSFLDADHKKVSAECEITNSNGYPEFSASGEYNGSLGQCFESVKPANEAQKQFIELWKVWHLNGMNAGTKEQTDLLKDAAKWNEFRKDNNIQTVVFNDLFQKQRAKVEDMLLNKSNRPPDEVEQYLNSDEGRKNIADDIFNAGIALMEKIEDKDPEGYDAKCYFLKFFNMYEVAHPKTGEPYKYGHGWITNDLPEDFEDNLDTIIDQIEEAEEERKGESLADMQDKDLIALIEAETSFNGRDAELCAALVKMFDLSQDDLQDVEIDETNVTVQGNEYIAGDDSEMDERLTEEVEQSAWAFTPSFLAEYCELPTEVFEALSDKCEDSNDAVLSLIKKSGSIEDFAQDAASADGRGHFLNRYDGSEETQEINGTDYYAYKQ